MERNRTSSYQPTVQPNLLATMVTTTTYGSWLPGDLNRLQQATSRMKNSPVLLTADQQTVNFEVPRTATEEFGYELTDASFESWHTHWMCHRGYDPVATMVGRLKNRMRQALNLDRIWTEPHNDGYAGRCDAGNSVPQFPLGFIALGLQQMVFWYTVNTIVEDRAT